MPTPDRSLVMKINELKDKLAKEKDPIEIAKLQAAIKKVQDDLQELTGGR